MVLQDKPPIALEWKETSHGKTRHKNRSQIEWNSNSSGVEGNISREDKTQKSFTNWMETTNKCPLTDCIVEYWLLSIKNRKLKQSCTHLIVPETQAKFSRCVERPWRFPPASAGYSYISGTRVPFIFILLQSPSRGRNSLEHHYGTKCTNRLYWILTYILSY